MSYNKVYEVYRKNPSTFPMAVAYLADKGYEFTKQITNEDIAELEGNGLMTKVCSGVSKDSKGNNRSDR